MATTKIWKVVKRLDHVVDYATDEIKTKNIEFRIEKGNYLVLVNDLNDGWTMQLIQIKLKSNIIQQE